MRRFAALLVLLSLSAFITGGGGNSARSSAGQEKPLITFGVFTDAHNCDCNPTGTRYYRKTLSKLKEAIKYFSANNAEFIVNLGDLIDQDFKSYRPVMKLLDSSGLKVFHVTGNHDYYIDHKHLNEIPLLRENKKGFYSFSHNGFRLIFLNGNEVSTYSSDKKKIKEAAQKMISELNKKGEPNGKENNGAIGADQLVWLETQLDQASAASERVFIFCHFPIIPLTEHNLLNYRNVLSILDKYDNIKAWFNGHNHAGNYGNHNRIHFVNFRAMVETENKNAFSVVEVYNNRIWIKGNGREKSQILAL